MADGMAERTEQPTPKRLSQARADGNVARSQELASAMILLAGTLLAAASLIPILWRFKSIVAAALSNDVLDDPVVPSDALALIDYVAIAAARITLPLLLVVAAAAFVVQFLQVGWIFTMRPLAPSLGKISPIKGLKRLFDLNAMFKTGLAVVKTAVIVVLVAATIYQYRREIVTLPYFAPAQVVVKGGLMMLDLALRLAAVLLLLGVLDYLYQRWKHKQDLKMTKQEVKDELKQMEGDPQVKRRRARMAQQIAMQRVNVAVPRADVVVTNPEHFSVAIKYDADRMNAPVMVAKGADFLALRIRQIALINGIPIVERPPLARALCRRVEVGQEIPPEFYHEVAAILAHVYRLSGAAAEQPAAGVEA
jgi:flagellar biosynthetic protein FlhB